MALGTLPARACQHFHSPVSKYTSTKVVVIEKPISIALRALSYESVFLYRLSQSFGICQAVNHY